MLIIFYDSQDAGHEYSDCINQTNIAMMSILIDGFCVVRHHHHHHHHHCHTTTNITTTTTIIIIIVTTIILTTTIIIIITTIIIIIVTTIIISLTNEIVFKSYMSISFVQGCIPIIPPSDHDNITMMMTMMMMTTTMMMMSMVMKSMMVPVNVSDGRGFYSGD